MVILAYVLTKSHGRRNIVKGIVWNEFRHHHIGSPNGKVVKGEHGIV